MKIKSLFSCILVITLAALGLNYVNRSSASARFAVDKTKAASLLDKKTRPSAGVHVFWETVVNNGRNIPGSNSLFNSFGQPSVNSEGMVIFRGRGTESARISGTFMRNTPKGNLEALADVNNFVPQPNNLDAEFTEFPAIPRIAINAANVATRGNHKPVYRFTLPDGSESRAGTTGLYAQLETKYLFTAASKLGAIPGFEFYGVPGTDPVVPFDVFPGAPAITDEGVILFKGNYTLNGIGKTGVFYRRLQNTLYGGSDAVEAIATSDTEIPNMPPSFKFKAATFGSTAPPSAAGNVAVFVGLDNEESPSYGGIYSAPIKPNPPLTPLVEIGEPLPGLSGIRLTRVGEGLSFDGRYLAFWGAWGREMKTVRLYCAVDGNRDLLDYCNGVDPLSVFDPDSGRWFQEREVPQKQGVFVYDMFTNTTYVISNSQKNFNDFVFWGYSGKPPGVGTDENSEPPRWRSAAFMTVFDGHVAFKARTGERNDKNEYINPIDGLYLADAYLRHPQMILAETGMDGNLLDSELPQGAMSITGIGIERDGFRGNIIAITATMANAEESWGGVYLGRIVGN